MATINKIFEVLEQRDTAWEELRQIREAIKANPEESTFDEVVKVVSQRNELLEALKRAQSFISEIGNAAGRFSGLHGDVVSESYRENSAAIDVIDRAEGKY